MRSQLLATLIIACNIAAFAQKKNEAPLGRGADFFPYPFANTYFISPRFDRVVHDGGKFFDTYYIRNVATLNGKNHFRFDVPVASTNITADSASTWGLGDVSFRYTRILGSVKELFFGAHCNVVTPTAVNSALGSGKWQAQVGGGGIYFRDNSKGTISFAAEYRFSFAGNKNRADIRQLAISPNADYWGRNWYAGYYATWMYDFESDKFNLPLDVEVGYSVIPALTFSAEFIQPLIKNSGYKFEFAVKLRYNILTY